MPYLYETVGGLNHGFEGNFPSDVDLVSSVNTEEAAEFEENHRLKPLGHDEDVVKINGDYSNIAVEDNSVTGSNGNVSEDDKISDGDNVSDQSNSAPITCTRSSLYSIEAIPNIWKPPKPEDLGDEVELSVANNDDDDDEYYGGTKWSKPSSLDDVDDEFFMHNSFKEERHKAMMEAMDGQLKFLVNQFLASEGISSYKEDHGESWLDIISSISWEAAMLVKPEGKAMDPGNYVKVKCIASGSPSQSEVIKGLVFKKNTAHKHMSTKLTSPRLLLLLGTLGHNAVGLSSFSSMDQEPDYLKFSAEIVRACSPNVVLVEKTVSRDIQECLLKKGITLAFDMKLSRLEKISRCTGSPIILSSEVPSNPQLRTCDLFHVEKFVEEHNRVGEGGKIPSKTLMFFEGCPKPLGCTILLRGAPSDVLKRVKRVVQYTVFGAYHLILETSFFMDQRVMLTYSPNFGVNVDSASDMPFLNGECVSPLEGDTESTLIFDGDSTSRTYDFTGLDPDGIGVIEKVQPKELHVPESSSLSLGHTISSISSSDGSMEDPLPVTSSSSNGSDISSHDSKEKEVNSLLHVSRSSEALKTEIKEKVDFDLSDSNGLDFCDRKNRRAYKKMENTLSGSGLDSKSILVLSSSLCRSRRTICEQNHLSRIKYYGESDMSLGHFLQDILLNKKHSCSECNEPPESHEYSYTHVNGRLTALVKRLESEYRLPGEAEGKIWVWTRCLKCEQKFPPVEPSTRVVMSNSAHNLSFGKFLELNFSTHSASKRFSKCGHSLQRDSLRFFGLGSLVGMFKYSPVDLYAACDPPPVMEFTSLSEDDWLKTEAKDVLQKVELLFLEIEGVLERMNPVFSRQQQKKLPIPLKEFSEVKELWKQEKSDLEVPLMKIIHNEENGQSTLDLTFLEWELLLERYAWDLRIDSLLSSAQEESDPPAPPQSESSEVIRFDKAEGEAETSEEDQSNRLDDSTEVNASDSLADSFASDNGDVAVKVDDEVFNADQESQRVPRFLESWIWVSSGIQKAYRESLSLGYSRKFDFIRSHSPRHLSPAVKQEREWVHLPVGTEHDHIISVSEDEISSLIAYAVATWQNQVPPENTPALRSEASFYLPSFNSLDLEAMRTSSFSSFSSDDTMASAPAEYSVEHLPMENLHVEVKLSASGPVDCTVFCVYAKQFFELRRRCCPSEAAYLTSLRRCKSWDAQGGKSKAFFAKTLDDRLIVKQIKRRELESFLMFAPDYFQHVSHSLSSGNQTCLAKILGIYRVKQVKNGKETKMDLMVMENLLYGREIARVYDLKGSTFSRYVADASEPTSVLLDQNFVEDMGFSPFYLAGKSKRHLQRAIWNDTSFLTSINVMDYSLLVGVDEQKQEMVFGIIDYLRQYTWDKQLETWVKSSLVVPKNTSPTVISPKDYKKRFRKFMSKHFLAVHDSGDGAL